MQANVTKKVIILHNPSYRQSRPPWLRQIITPIFPNVIMLSLGGERLTPKVLNHYLHHDLGMQQLLWCFFAHLLIVEYPDHHQSLINSSLYCLGPLRKIFHPNLFIRGQVDRALDSRSEGLGFDSQCWPCVEVSGKLRIPHCLGPPSRNGYLVHRSKVGSIVAGCRRRPLPGGR